MSNMQVLLWQNKQKSLKILQLQETVNKQNILLKQKEQFIMALQCLLKDRTHKINKMSSQLFKIEEEQLNYKRISKENIEQHSKIKELYKIIEFQSEEIKFYCDQQQKYIQFMQFAHLNSLNWIDQRTLLYQYKQQMQNQIQEIQETNQNLINKLQSCQQQIKCQNQQGNDLVGQIQYMIQCCEGVA